MREKAAQPKLDPIAELERVVMRDAATVVEIHAMLMQRQGRIADPMSDA